MLKILKPIKQEQKLNFLEDIDFVIKDVVSQESFLSVCQIATRTEFQKALFLKI